MLVEEERESLQMRGELPLLALAGKGSGILLCSLSVFWVIAGVLLTSRCPGGVCVGVYECAHRCVAALDKVVEA